MNGRSDIYYKVAQFLINIKTKHPREAICHGLVMDALNVETEALSLNKVTKKIEEKWKIKVPAVRVSDSLKTLRESGFLDKSNSRYMMTEKQKAMYEQSISNRVAFFEEVEQEWLESMQRIGRCRKLTGKEKKVIVEDFRNTIDHLCDKKANEVANFMCGDSNALEHTVIGDEIMRWLPKKRSRSKEIKDIEREIFPLFFQIDDVKRAKYVAGLAQTYIRRTIFECEVQGRIVLQGRLSSVNIYLDTNLIFDLVGLHGPKREEIAKHTVSIHDSLSISTLVDERSIKEFRAVLNNSRSQNIGPRVPRGIFREVKKAILDPRYKPQVEFVIPDDPFALLFWSSYLDEDVAEKGSRTEILGAWKRFLTHFEGIDTIIRTKYVIKIVNDSKNCNPDKQDFEEVNGLLKEAAIRYGIGKGPSAIEHDSLMFFMINMLREGEEPDCLPSNRWLLSADRSLIYFTRKMVERGKVNLSHFVPITGWTEMTIPFLTIQLVDEEDDAMILAKSLGEKIEQFEVTRMDTAQIGEILRRVPETFEKGPEVVMRCATDRHFRETVQKTFEKAKVKKEEIDEAVAQAFDDVKERVDLSDRKLIEELQRKVIAEKELAESLAEERKAREELEGELERTRRVIRRMKLVAVDIALTLLAGFTSWGAYFVVKPKFVPFEVDAAFWIVGTLYLITWLVQSLRKDVITTRWLICTFIPAVLILMIPLFWIYWGTVYLGIILPIWLAIMGYFVKLVGEPWLDFKIVLRWVGVKKK